MKKGWVKLFRRLADNELWLDEPFTRGQAWIDILMLASHAPASVRIRGIKVELQAGQLALSEVEFARRWRWSRNKVRRFLHELETIQQIEQQKTNITSVISITKWKHYQSGDTAKDTAKGTANDTAKGHIQECKEEEEDIYTPPLTEAPQGAPAVEKKKASTGAQRIFKVPSVEEVAEYCDSRNNGLDAEAFHSFYSSKGWKVGSASMKDWKSAVITWEKRNPVARPPRVAPVVEDAAVVAERERQRLEEHRAAEAKRKRLAREIGG